MSTNNTDCVLWRPSRTVLLFLRLLLEGQPALFAECESVLQGNFPGPRISNDIADAMIDTPIPHQSTSEGRGALTASDTFLVVPLLLSHC